VAEICHKSLRNEQEKEAAKAVRRETGKTEEEVQQMRASKLPSKVYIDPSWYRQYEQGDGQKNKFQRFLPKAWKLGDNGSHSTSSRRSSVLSRSLSPSKSSRKSLHTSPTTSSKKQQKGQKGGKGEKKQTKESKLLAVERPTRFSSRGSRGKSSPNYKEADSDDDDMLMNEEDVRPAAAKQLTQKLARKSVSFASLDEKRDASDSSGEENDGDRMDKEMDEEDEAMEEQNEAHEEEDEEDEEMGGTGDKGSTSDWSGKKRKKKRTNTTSIGYKPKSTMTALATEKENTTNGSKTGRSKRRRRIR